MNPKGETMEGDAPQTSFTQTSNTQHATDTGHPIPE